MSLEDPTAIEYRHLGQMSLWQSADDFNQEVAIDREFSEFPELSALETGSGYQELVADETIQFN